MDYYLLYLPLLAALLLLNLLTLKKCLKQLRTQKRVSPYLPSYTPQPQFSLRFKSTVLYLLSNLTLFEWCTTRRPRNQLPLLLSTFLILLCCYLYPSNLCFAFVGFTTVFVHLLLDYSDRADKDKHFITRLVFACGSCIAGVGLVALLYRNYQNGVLTQLATNVAINLVVDNAMVKPVMCLIMGAIFAKSDPMQEYIFNDRSIGKLMQGGIVVKPEENNAQIKFITKEEINKPMPILQEKNQQTYNRALSILQRIKKQRKLPPINCKNNEQNSQIHLISKFKNQQLLENVNKQPLSPIAKMLKEEKQTIEVGNYQKRNLNRRKVIGNENLILINTSLNNTESIQNQDTETIPNDKQQSKINSSGTAPPIFRIDLSMKTDTQIDRPMRINLNNNTINNEQDEEQCSVSTRRKSVEDRGLSSAKNTLGLKITEQLRPIDDVEEIDLTSPQKRKHYIQNEQRALNKKKKYSVDKGRQRVIKFTTGQPYLEYLPNLMSKKEKGGKAVSSVKRSKKKYDNDENEPEFAIENL